MRTQELNLQNSHKLRSVCDFRWTAVKILSHTHKKTKKKTQRSVWVVCHSWWGFRQNLGDNIHAIFCFFVVMKVSFVCRVQGWRGGVGVVGGFTRHVVKSGFVPPIQHHTNHRAPQLPPQNWRPLIRKDMWDDLNDVSVNSAILIRGSLAAKTATNQQPGILFEEFQHRNELF